MEVERCAEFLRTDLTVSHEMQTVREVQRPNYTSPALFDFRPLEAEPVPSLWSGSCECLALYLHVCSAEKVRKTMVEDAAVPVRSVSSLLFNYALAKVNVPLRENVVRFKSVTSMLVADCRPTDTLNSPSLPQPRKSCCSHEQVGLAAAIKSSMCL